jgi:hypothetical protein
MTEDQERTSLIEALKRAEEARSKSGLTILGGGLASSTGSGG